MLSKINDMNKILFSTKMLDACLEWIQQNLSPEDVFDESHLLLWMEEWMADNDVCLEKNKDTEKKK